MNNIYEINGEEIKSIDEFYDVVSELLLPREFWGKNLDALNDILSGGFNVPESPYTIAWLQAGKSKQVLGKASTINWYKQKVLSHINDKEFCEWCNDEIEKLNIGNGKTLFEMLVEVFTENSKAVVHSEKNITFNM